MRFTITVTQFFGNMKGDKMDSYEEEDDKLERFRELGRKLGEPEGLTIDEYVDYRETSDEMLNSFIEGYRSGIAQHHFKSLTKPEQKLHIHLLEIAMIIARQSGYMDNYLEMKGIVKELIQVSDGESSDIN